MQDKEDKPPLKALFYSDDDESCDNDDKYDNDETVDSSTKGEPYGCHTKWNCDLDILEFLIDTFICMFPEQTFDCPCYETTSSSSGWNHHHQNHICTCFLPCNDNSQCCACFPPLSSSSKRPGHAPFSNFKQQRRASIVEPVEETKEHYYNNDSNYYYCYYDEGDHDGILDYTLDAACCRAQ